jgi:hypothetical protein
VVLSPNDAVLAAEVVQRDPDTDEGAIGRIIDAARTHHPPYAAMVLDLPPTYSEWGLQPLTRANTLLVVATPNISDAIKLVRQLQLVTERFDPRYLIPRSAIYLVLNDQRREDNMPATAIQEILADHLNGWAPPVIATIPHDPQVGGVHPWRQHAGGSLLRPGAGIRRSGEGHEAELVAQDQDSLIAHRYSHIADRVSRLL